MHAATVRPSSRPPRSCSRTRAWMPAAVRPARQAGSEVGPAATRPGLGGHPDDRLWAWTDHSGDRGPRDRPLAATGRDHPRRPAGTREREAAALSVTLQPLADLLMEHRD